ncbi:sensor histidine kinase [Hymenobacter terrenus]|uniref:sensor histidine kinase n=1 Tax=Hymenobacter terrenus TaxID=1629124 RepID=UPI000698346C|nr:sensor histidine kinase [Hymenobacter terrenus]
MPSRARFLLLQVGAWLLGYGLVVAYMAQRIHNLGYICAFTAAAFASYAATIYGYIYGLHPRLYRHLPGGIFGLVVTAYLILIGAARFYVEVYVVRPFYPMAHPGFLSGDKGHLGYVAVTTIFALGFGLLARAALRSVILQQQKEELENKQLQAEMNLLKAQVQPHFLFNTLNNIYYEAYLEAPRTADLVEKLAALMRYFVDLSRQEHVPLSAEVDFLQNYIALEKIRFRHELCVNLYFDAAPDVLVPPMLLIPLVENLFKHSFDKRQAANAADLRLTHADGWLTFETTNALPVAPATSPGGFGLRNLRERLRLLYGPQFELSAQPEHDQFVARLKIPV